MYWQEHTSHLGCSLSALCGETDGRQTLTEQAYRMTKYEVFDIQRTVHRDTFLK